MDKMTTVNSPLDYCKETYLATTCIVAHEEKLWKMHLHLNYCPQSNQREDNNQMGTVKKLYRTLKLTLTTAF